MAKKRNEVDEVMGLPPEPDEPGNAGYAEKHPPAPPEDKPASMPPTKREHKFRPVSTEEDKYQRGFKSFREPGDTFVGRFVRAIAPCQDGLENSALEFLDEDGTPWLLPGNQQLWEFFQEHVAQDATRIGHLFQITLVERVMDKDTPNKVKFVRYRIAEDDGK